MANVEEIVPFIIRFEAGVTAAGLSNEQLFDKALKTGFANDPADSGGATMVGVTIGTFTEYCRRKGLARPTVEHLRNITYRQWLDILKTLYWDRWEADLILSQSVAEILVDWVWASGKYGITIPQKVLGVTPDGIVGKKTLAAVNDANPKALFDAIFEARKKFLLDITAQSIAKYERKIGRKATESEQKKHTNKRFLNGWLKRLEAIKQFRS